MSAPRQSRIDVAEDWRPFWQRIEAKAKPHEVAGEVGAEIDRRIELARDEQVNAGTDVHNALLQIAEDPTLHLRLREALSQFLHGSGFRWQFRQGDLTGIASDLEKAEADFRDLMHRVAMLSEGLSQAMCAFGDTPGAPEPHRVLVTAADVFNDFPKPIYNVADLARHARALERAVLAAHGPDEGNKALADTLQGDERDQLLSDLVALWRDTGRKIPRGKPKEREPFIEFVEALHAAIGAGEIPKIDEKVRALAT